MISNEDKIKIVHLLQEIKSLKFIDNFLKPLPDLFLQKIKHPMDLNILEDNFNNNKYKTLKQFKEDLSLIWKNAKKFKDKDDCFNKSAKQIQSFCNSFFRRKYNYSQNTDNNLGKKRRRKRNENIKIKNSPKRSNRNIKEINQKEKKASQNKNIKFDIKSSIKTRSRSNNKGKKKGKEILNVIKTDKNSVDIDKQQMKNIEKEKSNANKVIFKVTKIVENNADIKSSLVIEINDDNKSIEEPLIEEEQKQIIDENCAFIKEELHSLQNDDNKEVNNEDYYVDFSEHEKLKLLILISKLSVTNQVKLLYKIEDKHKKIITVLSGNLSISFKNMPKNHYLEVMQYGEQLLLDQNEFLNSEK